MSRSAALMPVGVSAPRAPSQAVAARLCPAWVEVATRICRNRSSLALLSLPASTSWAALHPRFDFCSARVGWVRPPGQLGKTPLLQVAGVEVCWSGGPCCQQESRVQAQPLPRCARCLPVFIRCPALVVLRVKPPVSLLEWFPLWWCCCGGAFWLSPFPLLPVPLPSKSLLALQLSRCSWVRSSLGK